MKRKEEEEEEEEEDDDDDVGKMGVAIGVMEIKNNLDCNSLDKILKTICWI